jgi:hypothetical protein
MPTSKNVPGRPRSPRKRSAETLAHVSAKAGIREIVGGLAVEGRQPTHWLPMDAYRHLAAPQRRAYTSFSCRRHGDDHTQKQQVEGGEEKGGRKDPHRWHRCHRVGGLDYRSTNWRLTDLQWLSPGDALHQAPFGGGGLIPWPMVAVAGVMFRPAAGSRCYISPAYPAANTSHASGSAPVVKFRVSR